MPSPVVQVEPTTLHARLCTPGCVRQWAYDEPIFRDVFRQGGMMGQVEGQLRIETVFAFVVIDTDGTEGIPAVRGPDGMAMPLVAADPERLASLRPVAQLMAMRLGKRVELIRFTTRTHLDWLEP